MWFNLKFHPFSCGRVAEPEPVCTQCRKKVIHIITQFSTFSMPYFRSPTRGVPLPAIWTPDLMVPPCLKADFYKLSALFPLQNPVTQNRLFRSRPGRRNDFRTVFFSILTQKIHAFGPVIHQFFHISVVFHIYSVFCEYPHLCYPTTRRTRQVRFFHFSL